MNLLRAALFSALAILVVYRFAPALKARGAINFDQEACVLKIGPDLVYFTGYQLSSPNKKFCEDVPGAGETVFVFDFAQPELRDMTAELRILREVDEAAETADIEAATVAHLAPNTYPKGSMSLEHTFTEPGNYVGVLTVDGTHGEHWAARFPFSVGGAYSLPRIAPYVLLAVAAGLGALLLFWRGGVGSRPGAGRIRR